MDTRYDRTAELPPTRHIEIADMGPIAVDKVPYQEVAQEPYLTSPALEDAVNLAIALGRPILLQGDPGSGKTRLAHALSYALGLPLEQAHIKSTSRGQDLLYTFDAVRRLFDVQTAARGADPDLFEPSRYVRFGPLGRAIVRAQCRRRSVVLIDEVDKADLDFPNDLLRELDRLAFEVAEVPNAAYSVPEDHPGLRPIIVVTNNEEKVLPDAFLRRCIFHHVPFPNDPQDLERILALHRVRDQELAHAAVKTLTKLRELDLAKKPGISELLDWVQYLAAINAKPSDLTDVPFRGALVKQRVDQMKVDRSLSER